MSRLIKIATFALPLFLLISAATARAEWCLNYSGTVIKNHSGNTYGCVATREACLAEQNNPAHRAYYSGSCYERFGGGSHGSKGSSDAAIKNTVRQTLVEGIVGGVLGAALNPPPPKNPQSNVHPTAEAFAQQQKLKQQKQAEEAARQTAFSTNQRQLLSDLKGDVSHGKSNAIDLKMPPQENNHILNTTGALDEEARKKQLAECPGISEKIARYQNGIRHIDEVMTRNERFIREAEEDGKKADDDLSKVKSDAAAEALSMGLKSFVQTQKNLQTMRNTLDKIHAGKGGNAGTMSYDQIVQAKKWLDKGLAHGQDVIDLTQKSIEYSKSSSLRGNDSLAASPYSEKLKTALTDFNDKFMYDAGGWEFVGEHLAEAGGGVAGEIAFKTAVAGIKATAAGIGMKISKDQLRVYNENQDKMARERYRLEQRIEELKTAFVNNRCPKQ